MEPVITKKSPLRYLRLLFYLVPVALLLLGYASITVVTGESYPFTIVTGTSMQPTILPGSVAVIDKVPFDQLKVGEVIVFVPQLALLYPCDGSPGASLTSESPVPCYVIHRIVAITTDSHGNRIIETKGDNNPGSIPYIDTNINSSMYVGEVVMQFPLAGYITEQPYNEYIALVILGALVGELYFERKITAKRPAQS
ncbi:MAG: S26 family signal peptidase [Nitrososphaerota archaeon]|nr:S26 family signal peptidase [Nitrososphaerota archaeon]